MEYWILQEGRELLSPGYSHPATVPLNRDYWHISRYANNVRVGDMAFIWHSGSPAQRGIRNVAKIVSAQHHTPDAQQQIELLQQSDARYWTDVSKRDKLRRKPAILIELQYPNDLQPPILVGELRQHGFGNLLIIHMPRWGIYRLGQTEGERLLRYIQGTR